MNFLLGLLIATHFVSACPNGEDIFMHAVLVPKVEELILSPDADIEDGDEIQPSEEKPSDPPPETQPEDRGDDEDDSDCPIDT